MSGTTDYIKKRLKDESLSDGERAALKTALKSQVTYHGFHIGDRVDCGSYGHGTVVDMELFYKNHSVYRGRDESKNPYVPVRYDYDGRVSGYRAVRLKKL